MTFADLIALETRCPRVLALAILDALEVYAAALDVRADHATTPRAFAARLLCRVYRENYEALARHAERLVTPPPTKSLAAKWLAMVMEEAA